MILRFLSLWNRARAKVFLSLVRHEFAAVGRQTTLELPLRLGGTRRIAIGSSTYVGRDSWLEVMEPDRPRHGPAISIGNRVSIAGFCTITAVRGVVIEDDVLIARYAYISDHAHAFSDPERPIKDQGITNIAPVRIGAGAWLGQGVVICPGVTIGRNAVIGANSVVRQDVPDFSVAAGVPARVIRRIGPVLQT